MKSRISTATLFAKAKVGLGASKQVGSDCYGYYISFVDPKTKTIGLYTPKHWFKNDWTDGSMEVEPYRENTPPTLFLQAFRGRWYKLDRLGNRECKYSVCIGHCAFYMDPSF